MIPSLDGKARLDHGRFVVDEVPDQEVSALELLASDLADPDAVLAFFGRDVQALKRMTPQQIREVVGHTAAYHVKRGKGPGE